MISIQPYFVFATNEYHKRIIEKNGIAHCYKYRRDFKEIENIIAVPDGCIDIIFEKSSKNIVANACGTVLKSKVLEYKEGNEYYGIRFMQGILPVNLHISMKELLENQVDLSYAIKDKDVVKRIEEDWENSIDIFIENYIKELYEIDKNISTMISLVNYITSVIIKNKGNMKIEEISEYTGYSTRYINKVFNDHMGMNPKTFNKIIQFQNSIQKINNNLEEKLILIGLETGYYDQAHFIREFKKNIAMTPKEYKKAVKEYNYSQRIDVKDIDKNRLEIKYE